MSISSMIANSHRNVGTNSDTMLNIRPITTESVSFFSKKVYTENNSVRCLDSVLVTG